MKKSHPTYLLEPCNENSDTASVTISTTKTEIEPEPILNFHLKMIILDDQPFTMVENKGFSAFVKELDPRYKLPHEDIFQQHYWATVTLYA